MASSVLCASVVSSLLRHFPASDLIWSWPADPSELLLPSEMLNAWRRSKSIGLTIEPLPNPTDALLHQFPIQAFFAGLLLLDLFLLGTRLPASQQIPTANAVASTRGIGLL